MSTWTKQKLGDVVDINSHSINKNFSYDQIEYVDISSVGTGKLENITKISLADAPSRARRLVEDGDTILATVRPNRRSFLYVKNPPKNRVVSTGFAVLTPSKIDSRFLYYIISQQEFTDYLSKNAKGAAYPAVDEGIINRADVFLPDLPTQTRIASVLSAYDDLIENNEKRIKILEEMAERLYREWFVKFNFPGHEKVRLIDSGTEYGEIPEGWEVISLSDAVSINPATRLKTKENITHVSMECLSNTLSTIDHNKITKKNGGTGTKFINGDTLFARITPCLQNGKNAFVNFLDKDEIATGSTEFIVLRAKKLSSVYIYFMTRDADFRKSAEMTMVGASGRQRVQGAFFQSHVVIIPDHSLLAIFESHVKSNFSEIEQLRKANQNLSKTRDLLIPQLVVGRRELK